MRRENELKDLKMKSILTTEKPKENETRSLTKNEESFTQSNNEFLYQELV